MRCVRRVRELESELADVKGLAMLLGKTAELQGAQALPPSDHAVWSAVGALGGVQHTLDVVLRHLKVGCLLCVWLAGVFTYANGCNWG